MTNKMKTILAVPMCCAMALTLNACDSNNNDTAMVPPSPPPAPPPPPPPTGTTYDVTPCLTQEVTAGVTVADLVIPDTLKIFFSSPAGFPNGRVPGDPVINRVLNVLFLDLSVHPATAFENFDGGNGLNINHNDRPLPAGFPYLAPPQGQSAYNLSTGGSGFNFRTSQPNGYTRVDRMGQPAVSTALVGSDKKSAYNDGNPAGDLRGGDFGRWGPEFASQLTAYTNALADDLLDLGLTPCAVEDS